MTLPSRTRVTVATKNIAAPSGRSGTAYWDNTDPNYAPAHYICDGTNDASTINSALAENIEVYLYDGSYNIDTPIAIPSGATLRGNSQGATILWCNNATAVIQAKTPLNSSHVYVVVDTLAFGVGDDSDLACDFRGFSFSTFSNLHIHGFDLAVWFGGDLTTYESCWTNAFNNFDLENNLVGIKLSGTVDGVSGHTPTANMIMLHQGTVGLRDTTGAIGIDVVDGGEIVVDAVDIESGTYGDGIILEANATNCRIVNSRFEWGTQDSGNYPIKIESGSLYHYIAGNTYTDDCTLPNVLDENGSDGVTVQIDARAHNSAYGTGFAEFNTPVALDKSASVADWVYIHTDNDHALAVSDSNDGSVFRVNTNTKTATVANGGAVSLCSDEFDTDMIHMYGDSGRIDFAGDLVSYGTTPTIPAGPAAGTSPTKSISGTNTSGLIKINPGTSPTIGKLLDITWSSTKVAPNGYAVVLTPANAAAAGVMSRIYVDASTQSTSVAPIYVATTALAHGTDYWFYYQVVSF